MALPQFLILRKPHSGCLEGRTAPIQRVLDFFHRLFRGVTRTHCKHTGHFRPGVNLRLLFVAREHTKAVAVRHLHLRQRLRVHRIGLADDAIQLEDIGGDRINLVVAK